MDFKNLSIVELEKTIREAVSILNDKKDKRRAELLSELESLGEPVKVKPKSKPKFKGPNGESWSGRGALPSWAKTLGVSSREGMEPYRV